MYDPLPESHIVMLPAVILLGDQQRHKLLEDELPDDELPDDELPDEELVPGPGKRPSNLNSSINPD